MFATECWTRWKDYDDRDLKIDVRGIDLSLVERGIPVLESHRWAGDQFGLVDDAWVENDVLKAALGLTGKSGREMYERAMARQYIGISAGLSDLSVVEETGLHSYLHRTFIARRSH